MVPVYPASHTQLVSTDRRFELTGQGTNLHWTESNLKAGSQAVHLAAPLDGQAAPVAAVPCEHVHTRGVVVTDVVVLVVDVASFT